MSYQRLKIQISGFALLIGVVGGLLLSLWIKTDSSMLGSAAFGSVIGILMFWQTAKAVEKAASLGERGAQKHMMNQYMIRYAIYGLVLFLSIKNPRLHIVGVFWGLISIKPAVMILPLLQGNNKPKS